jgi:hypothetical protein
MFPKVFFVFPTGFFLGVMTPLHLAELDGFGAGSPFCGL